MTLQEIRTTSKLTQEELAQYAGTSSVFISLIESGKSFPSPAVQRRIESILGPISWLETRLPSNTTTEDSAPVITAILAFMHGNSPLPKAEKIKLLQRVLTEIEKEL